MHIYQRWSRGHKALGQSQGNKKISRPRTALPRTDPLEAKDRNARGQDKGHKLKCSPEKKVFKNFFQAISRKKDLQKFFSGDLQKKTSPKNFQAIYKILTVQKIVLPSSREHGNFRGLEASRPRTSKCVLEDSTSDIYLLICNQVNLFLISANKKQYRCRPIQNF